MLERKLVSRESTEIIILEELVPQDPLLTTIDRGLDLAKFWVHLKPFYSHIGRPSVDPALIIGYCCGIRSSADYTRRGTSAWLPTGFATLAYSEWLLTIPAEPAPSLLPIAQAAASRGTSLKAIVDGMLRATRAERHPSARCRQHRRTRRATYCGISVGGIRR